MNIIQRALNYFRGDAPRMAVIFVLMLSSIGLNLLKPWPLAIIVDSVLGDKPMPNWLASFSDSSSPAFFAGLLALGLFFIHLSQGAFSAFQNFLAIKVGLSGLSRVRNEVFAKLQELSLRFHQGANAGDLIYRASWDTYAFQTLFQQGLITFVTSFLSLGLMIVVMAQLNLPLTLFALAAVPVLIVTIRVFGRKMSERTTSAQQADSKVTSLVQQSIAAMPLIQSYTREAQEKKRFSGQVAEAQQRRITQHGAELVYWFGIAAVFAVGAAGLTWLGADQVLKGKLTIGQLLVFLGYLALLYEPLNQLSQVGATVSGAMAGVRRIFELLDTPNEVCDPPTAKTLTAPVAGRIDFENVFFAYDDKREVLQNISFTIAPGESIAIIGPSGAGKTTLLNLLPRFFDPSKGCVKLDGTDLREFKLSDLRSQVSLVLQQPIILPGTIAENIAYGNLMATREQIEVAARAANAHEFIERFPKKYETSVGDGAARLSIGEQQRLNLARAFLKNAPVLLLDEPTSALDAENEMLVMESLRELMRNRTTLIVAHRPRTIERVDKVLVLQNGQIEKFDTLEKVREGSEYYKRMLAARGV
ncbi:MAG: ABC transporter ATP-binding protein [Verrucomicrobia bacterium]|nr:ABC transporter ATP-binding protein [Verrucomicrobiota bacterium]